MVYSRNDHDNLIGYLGFFRHYSHTKARPARGKIEHEIGSYNEAVRGGLFFGRAAAFERRDEGESLEDL